VSITEVNRIDILLTGAAEMYISQLFQVFIRSILQRIDWLDSHDVFDPSQTVLDTATKLVNFTQFQSIQNYIIGGLLWDCFFLSRHFIG